MQPCVYILASKRNGTLYIGVTSDLVKPVWEHKEHLVEGFTKKYSVSLLVYFEVADSMYTALAREKQLRNWQRQWKINLIETTNPEWNDLFDEIR